jgi:hypothetical protein
MIIILFVNRTAFFLWHLVNMSLNICRSIVWFVHDGAVIVVGENMAPHLVIDAIWLCMLHKMMVH